MFPVSSSGLRLSLGDVPTDIHVSRYADRLLCFVTQTGTCGSILQAKCVWVVQRRRTTSMGCRTVVRGDGSVDVVIEPLFGRRDREEMFVCAKRLALKFRQEAQDSRSV